jgi:hypothetical protein
VWAPARQKLPYQSTFRLAFTLSLNKTPQTQAGGSRNEEKARRLTLARPLPSGDLVQNLDRKHPLDVRKESESEAGTKANTLYYLNDVASTKLSGKLRSGFLAVFPQVSPHGLPSSR